MVLPSMTPCQIELGQLLVESGQVGPISAECHVDRRSFLRLFALLPLFEIAAKVARGRRSGCGSSNRNLPNMLLLVFDALSAGNMSLYGYPRRTTPNVERFAERSAVYHRHYAGGNFTTPGTASLLTGVYPWSHRAFHVYGQVNRGYRRRNLFGAFDQAGLRRISYTHNDLAEVLLYQFRGQIDRFLKADELALFYDKPLSEGPFFHDRNAAFFAEGASLRGGDQDPASLFASILQRVWRTKRKSQVVEQVRRDFPLGAPTLPGAGLMFTLEDGIDYLQTLLDEGEGPFLGYFHFYPPHGPFHTRREFVHIFDDDYQPIPKPHHFFTGGESQSLLNRKRREYDEFIAYVDAEFGRLVDYMHANGHFDDTILIFTSDHGQMFERGILGHTTETLYEPIIRIPLLISRPGDETRQDIHIPTSCVDVLPSLLHIMGEGAPAWSEGRLLPGLGEPPGTDPSPVFSVEAKTNASQSPLRAGSLAMLKDHYKLIHYFGYPDLESEFEFFDLGEDPEELRDLYPSRPSAARRMQAELQGKLNQVNQPFES
jgi:arylsulfatase A-like enzyme